ncbi:ECF transporter S component [Aerococcus sp. UMB7834]|uniref:ECF transporter S component n=1 Tax=Aerococcus sp. UMB7834 TaxID=3046342 RepID=UPI00254AB9FB|nr:ECF transporter S component [Aerococcus sp. UMB7834]MDK6805060.1 ECF transporter S component [Aerococcus sp. UMB7834]
MKIPKLDLDLVRYPNFQQLSLTRRLTNLSLWVAVAVVGRVLVSGVPNVQPVTDMVILAVPLFGLSGGLIVATLIMLLSNLILGMGSWTLGQILAYGAVVLISYLLMKLGLFKYPLAVLAWSLVAGYCYGLIVSYMMLILFGLGMPFWTYYLAGLPYDTGHALGNLAFMLILVPICQRLIREKIL